jgi:hypothetical protein
VERQERERILRQGAVRANDPRDRAFGRTLAADLDGSPLAGRPLRQRARNFTATAESYLAALGGPLPYMQRLRQIADETAAHEEALEQRRQELAARCGRDAAAFARRWLALAERWNFSAVNELIEQHNRWFPIEARLPMDPRTGDFALVNGEHYARRPLDAEWILARFAVERAA